MKTLKVSGFTLIELVIVIVILGILASVAAPKFVNMTGNAAVASADGAYGAAQSAATINFSAVLMGTTPAATPITTGATLLAAMTQDGTWTSTATGIKKTINGTVYTISIASAETATDPAVLSKSW